MEPVHACAVDYSGEHSCSLPESLANRGEAQGQMEVLSHVVQIELEDFVRSVLAASSLCRCSHLSKDSVQFVLWEDIGNPAAGEDIIDVHKELLFCDLSVGQNEENLGPGNSRFLVETLEVSFEVSHSVVGGDNDSDDFVLENESGQLGEGLLSRATNTDQQGVSDWQVNDS